MFALNSLKTRVSGSPTGSDSERRGETPKSANSTMEVGEIDTRAPIRSVKAAVSLFGETTASPNSKHILFKKPKTADERVLEKETQLHLALKELNKFKDHLKQAEDTKAQAGKDLEKANRTLQELTSKLETASESKQAAIAATEAAKSRAKELEEAAKSGKAQPGNTSWKQDVDSEREQYKASAGELIATKQELTNIRQDFDAALVTKLAAFQQAADSQHATKVNKERLDQLSKEFETVRETLSQVKLATAEAQMEQAKHVADKEALLHSHKSSMEEMESKIRLLKEEETQLELYGNLEEKLEETSEGIKVLKEQLKNVRESDLTSLISVTSELEDAKNALKLVLTEESSLRNSVDSLKAELDEVKKELLLLNEQDKQSDLKVQNLRNEVEKSKSELETISAVESKERQDFDDMVSTIEQLTSEAEEARKEAEEMKLSAENLKREAEIARNETKLKEEKLQVSLKEAEEAKAAAKLASDQIHDIDATSSDSQEKIKLSIQDFEVLSKKSEEIENMAQAKVAAAMEEVEALNASEMEAIKKLEASWKEIEHIKAATEDSLRKADMAENAKKAVEGELQKWRRQENAMNGVAETSITK